MNGDAFWFGGLPTAAVILTVVAVLYRFFTHPVRLAVSGEPARPRSLDRALVSLQWGLGIVLGAHLLALVLPVVITSWNASPARLYILEGTGLGLALWALLGLVVLAVRGARHPRALRPLDVAVAVVLGVAMVSGILVAVLYRFGSFWGTELLGPYLWSLVGPDPKLDVVGELPWLVQLHTLSLFLVLPLIPLSTWFERLLVPVVASARRALASVQTRPAVAARVQAVGSRLTWAGAYLRAIPIVAVFFVLVAWLPSFVLGRIGDAPRFAQEVIGSGVWFVAMAGILVGLRYAQKTGKI